MNTPKPFKKQEVIGEVEASINELDEGEKLIRDLKPTRVCIELARGLIIEVSTSKASTYMEERVRDLQELYEKIRSET